MTCLDFCCGIMTIGLAISLIICAASFHDNFSHVIADHLRDFLRFRLERARAEHEARIKLIKGLD